MIGFIGFGRLRVRLLLLVMCGVLLCSIVQAQGISREDRLRMLEAVVQVQAFDIDTGLWMQGGSGTIVSPDGYLLTNYHVIGDLDLREHYEWAGIFTTSISAPDLPPRLSYWARYVAGDPALDLAVLRIVEYSDETPVEAGKQFPAMPVGDSNSLVLGDTLTVVGYPSISGSTITFTQGIMSGWLGEDTLSGGKQWIKTDAKIARGNSGGGAFNLDGQLVGIPTMGIHGFDGQLYEEQLMIRPVALAWALLGPHVPNVLRGATGTIAGQTGTDAQDQVAAGQPSGVFGALTFGQSVTGLAAAVPEGANLVYHTYVLEIPDNADLLAIRLEGDADIGLAGKFGSEILTYDDVDFIAADEGISQLFEIADPVAGELWIDVVHWERTGPVTYTLTAEVTAVPPTGQVSPDGSAGIVPVNYPAATQFGTIGTLQPGVVTPGNLLQSPGVAESTYHTYTVDVPAGTAELTLELSPLSILDLVVKHGSQIMSYAAPDSGGDWHHAAITETVGEGALLVIPDPAAGRWFVDVVNWENTTADGRYTVVARLR